MRTSRWAAAPLALTVVLGATACTERVASTPQAANPPFADCATLTVAPSPAAGATASGGASDLPAMRLPCFTGGRQVDLTAIRGPAVINLWASWCEPCRTELPVIQRLADRAQGRLHVLGVDTGDRPEAGASFAADHQVTMPTLVDADRKLFDALAGRALPMTLFVDAAGRRSLYLLPLDDQHLAEQVRAHTGVTVTG